jgi:Zn-dependent protease with chaperone function
MERKKLLLLHPSEYEHEFDRKALKNLEGNQGLEKFMKKIYKHSIERINRISHSGSFLKITSKNFPEIYELLEEGCANIHLKEIPDLYVKREDSINAFTTGVKNPLILLHTATIDHLTPDELLYIIGHEVGHIKSGHMLYHDMAQYIKFAGEIVGEATLGIGSLISRGLEYPLLHWARMSEFTCDRAGLLTCQDLDVAMDVEMKMAGVPNKYCDKVDNKEFIKQAKEFEGYDHDSLDKVAKTYLIMEQTHPWSVMRASELLKWYETGRYDEIVDKHGKDSIEELEISCTNCGRMLKGTESFCGVCGTKVGNR